MSKKVCIITMGNIYLVPYLSVYSKYLSSPYSVIYWDRANIEERSAENVYYRFDYPYKNNKIAKLIGYVKFSKFVDNILSNNEFDIVIMLQTLGALVCSNTLLKKYRHKYLIDIRDYTYENVAFIKRKEKRLIDNALMNVVSSEGYLQFLPHGRYEIAHNVREWPNERVEQIRNRKKIKDKLTIVFVGYVNYQDIQKKLILALKNDERFALKFIGTRSEELLPFCREHNVENVTLIGTFDSKQTLDFYEDADLVNNIYGNNSPHLDYALSNKLYYAASLLIPILVCPGTFMEDIANKYEIGLSVDKDKKSLGDYIYSYYQNIDWKKFANGCDQFMQLANKQQSDFERKLSDLFE